MPMAREITSNEAWKITYHEAGHAFVAARLKIPFNYVERGEGEHGLVDVSNGPLDDFLPGAPKRTRTEDEISHWQKFFAAGAAAERLLFGSYRDYASSHDQAKNEKLETLRPQQRSDGWERDVQSAMEILDQEAVKKLAGELDREKKLAEAQVYEILGFASPYD
jgi:hypothetical protein